MRYYSEALNIDKNRVAIYGGSAGAGTSLWLAFHNDMADEYAEGPVLQESRRVSAAAAKSTRELMILNYGRMMSL